MCLYVCHLEVSSEVRGTDGQRVLVTAIDAHPETERRAQASTPDVRDCETQICSGEFQ